MFKDIFGNSPQTLILDFLADHPQYDYTISDISTKSKVSRPTVYKFLNILLQKKIIIKTRVIGNSSLYKINLDNNLVKIMLKFDFELAKEQANLESGNDTKGFQETLSITRISKKTRNIRQS